MYKQLLFIILVFWLFSCSETQSPTGNECKIGETEACYTGKTETKNKGICKGGIRACNTGGNWGECENEITPEEEICDGLDNDCNGTIDDNLIFPVANKLGGVCANQKKVCDGENGWKEPNYFAIPSYEEAETKCDGLDNNCDGSADNHLNPVFSDKQKGVCKDSQKLCMGVNGWQEPDFFNYSEEYERIETLCDGLDNDCNGIIDDGFPDNDGDEIADCVDEDDDNDGIIDINDNCPFNYNPEQTNTDNDEFADACDDDDDNDGVNDNDENGNPLDNCQFIANGIDEDNQLDTDNDGYGDACDTCNNDPNKQEEGLCGCNIEDIDTDGDTIPDCNDNCIYTQNTDQANEDGDSKGDLCDMCVANDATSEPEEICNGIDDDCNGVIDESGVCNSNCIREEYDNHVYLFCNEELNWLDAKYACNKMNYTLVVLNDETETNWVNTKQTEHFGDNNTFLGLNDLSLEANYIWSDNITRFDYNWADNQPDNGGESQVLSFDSVNDYIDMGVQDNIFANSTDLTITAWVKLNSFGAVNQGRQIIGQWDWSAGADYRNWGLGISNGEIEWSENGEYANFAKVDYPLDNKFHHISIIRNHNQIKLYIDAIEKTTFISENDEIQTGLPEHLLVGAYQNGEYGNFDGLIDDIQVYNRALEVSELINIANGSTEPDLIIHYDFEGNNLTDALKNKAGDDYNGEAINGPVLVSNTVKEEDCVTINSENKWNDLSCRFESLKYICENNEINYLSSCKEILDNGFSVGDGFYMINPDTNEESTAFEVYCDMTTDGGGWTHVLSNTKGSTFGGNGLGWPEVTSMDTSFTTNNCSLNGSFCSNGGAFAPSSIKGKEYMLKVNEEFDEVNLVAVFNSELNWKELSLRNNGFSYSYSLNFPDKHHTNGYASDNTSLAGCQDSSMGARFAISIGDSPCTKRNHILSDRELGSYVHISPGNYHGVSAMIFIR